MVFKRHHLLVSCLLTLAIGQALSAQSNKESHPENLRIITHNVWYGFTKKKGTPVHPLEALDEVPGAGRRLLAGAERVHP